MPIQIFPPMHIVLPYMCPSRCAPYRWQEHHILFLSRILLLCYCRDARRGESLVLSRWEVVGDVPMVFVHCSRCTTRCNFRREQEGPQKQMSIFRDFSWIWYGGGAGWSSSDVQRWRDGTEHVSALDLRPMYHFHDGLGSDGNGDDKCFGGFEEQRVVYPRRQ